MAKYVFARGMRGTTQILCHEAGPIVTGRDVNKGLSDEVREVSGVIVTRGESLSLSFIFDLSDFETKITWNLKRNKN